MEKKDKAADELVPLLYDELHQIAARLLGRERVDHTLQPTALVHEAYLKLCGVEQMKWRDRQHFLAFAARLVRQILVDHARGKKRQKRGGNWQRVSLSGVADQENGAAVDILDLEEALTDLERLHERHARVVELRFFSELSLEEIAAHLDVSPSTVKNDWKSARVWLEVRLAGGWGEEA